MPTLSKTMKTRLENFSRRRRYAVAGIAIIAYIEVVRFTALVLYYLKELFGYAAS